jgi:hypothetical protein
MAAARSTPASARNPACPALVRAGPGGVDSRANENKFIDGVKTVRRMGMDLPSGKSVYEIKGLCEPNISPNSV